MCIWCLRTTSVNLSSNQLAGRLVGRSVNELLLLLCSVGEETWGADKAATASWPERVGRRETVQTEASTVASCRHPVSTHFTVAVIFNTCATSLALSLSYVAAPAVLLVHLPPNFAPSFRQCTKGISCHTWTFFYTFAEHKRWTFVHKHGDDLQHIAIV